MAYTPFPGLSVQVVFFHPTASQRLPANLNGMCWRICLFGATVCLNAFAEDYPASIWKWREARTIELTRPGGDLSHCGLFMLREGLNRIGASESNNVVVTTPSTPQYVATLELRKGTVTVSDGNLLRSPAGAELASGAVLIAPGKTASETYTVTPDFKIYVWSTRRGTQIGITAWDMKCPVRTGFSGLQWYPVNENYRITAEWTAFPEPRRLRIQTTSLGPTEVNSPGFATFRIGGQERKLQAQGTVTEPFFVFGDATNSTETAPGGRRLSADPPAHGKIVLDFNRAKNLGCHYDADMGSCALPIPENVLPEAIPAGERRYRR